MEHLKQSWVELPEDVPHDGLARIFEDWKDTPYRPNAQKKGIGVDCVRFVTGVLDELTGREVVDDMDQLPTDVSMTQPETARAALRKIIRRYPGCHKVNDTLQPGDIVVAGNAGPGHGFVVGTRKNTMWHSINDDMRGGFVALNGWALPHGQTYFGAYRLAEDVRRKWIVK